MTHAGDFSLKASLDLLKANGLRPRTVFDVGVASGTPGLYQTFDDVRYVLVDPLVESELFMRDICARFSGAVYELAAAGAAAGQADFGIDPGLSGSSFFRGGATERRPVPVITLSSLVEKYDLDAPFLLKLDVQGFEIQVLRGFEGHLRQTDAIVAETNFWADRKGKGAPTHHELIAYMAEHGFMVYDIAGVARRPRDGALAEADFVFVRADSPLRAHATSRTPEQLAERMKQKAAKFARRDPQL